MAVTIYSTANGTRYVKIRREQNRQVKQLNIRIPAGATDADVELLLQEAKKKEMTLFPHPKSNFLEWYWSSGKPKCITLDRTNLRLNIQKTLVLGNKAEKPLSYCVGITTNGTKEAVRLITERLWWFHSAELVEVDRTKFEIKLNAWLVKALSK